MYSNTRRITTAGTKTATYESHGHGKTKLLVFESVYWICMNADIESHIKIVLFALIFSKLNQKKIYSSQQSRQTVGGDRSGHVYFK